MWHNKVMIITPNNEAYLLKAPLAIDELHQLDFANETAQVNYFQSLPKLALMRITYQRENESLVVPYNIETIRSYNYVMYKNTNYGNKWFYAFITGMTYESNTVTTCQIRTDCFQTYLFDFSWQQSYIKRETVADDTFGKHLLPEDVDTGDYIVNHSKTTFVEVANTQLTATGNNKTPMIVVQCSEKVGVIYDSQNAGANVVDDTFIIGSMPQGSYYYFFENLPTGESGGGYDSFTKFRNHLDSIGKGNAIINMFLIPKGSGYQFVSRTVNMYNGQGQESGTKIVVYEPSANTYGATLISSPTYPIPTTIGSYTPKNNKMFTAQFNYFMITNYAGGALDFHWEDFKSPLGVIATPTFRINGVVSANASFSIQPTNSIKSEVDTYGNKISTEFLAGAILPTLSWESDYYLNWIAQNGEKMKMKQQNALVDVLGSAIGSGISTTIASGNIGVGAVSAGFSALGGMLDYQNLVDEINEEKRVAEIIPNSVEGNKSAGDLPFALNSVGFAFINYQIREDMAIKIDRYLSMFGYRVNEIKTPNTKTRSKWNYIETVGANITGDIPQEALAEIKHMFNNGLTIWHDPSHFMDYNQTNSIV